MKSTQPNTDEMTVEFKNQTAQDKCWGNTFQSSTIKYDVSPGCFIAFECFFVLM